MSLLANADVRSLVPQEDFSDDQLAVTMRLVAGWLREATGLTEIGDLTDTHALWSPALELVALVAENPTSLASRTAGPTSATWPQARRRDAILRGVTASYTKATSGPRGTFPPAPAWPDPAWPDPAWPGAPL
jgi:hypothetical protein